jgi:hypothetical protein
VNPAQSPPRAEGWTVVVTRPCTEVTLFDVSLASYRELFTVAEGPNTLAITSLEPGEGAYPEPQVFVFAKPYDWRNDLADDEALLQVWQAVGVKR